MHELLLFSPVPDSSHTTLLHQLAGITRMQPIPTTEHHLVFRANTPTGLDRVLQQGSGSGGGSQGIAAPEMKRTRDMLTGSLYHLQLVRDVSSEVSISPEEDDADQNGTTNDTNKQASTNTPHKPNWTIHFSDIPEPSTTLPVTSRFVSRTPIDDPSSSTSSTSAPSDSLTRAISFLSALGYSQLPQSSYLLHGHKFYDADTTIFLYRVLPLPSHPENQNDTRSTSGPSSAATADASIPALSTLKPLDSSGSYILQASIELGFQPTASASTSTSTANASSSSSSSSTATERPPPNQPHPATGAVTNDSSTAAAGANGGGASGGAANASGSGNNSGGASFAELRAQATQQLLALRDTLRASGVVLAPGDRLALDTRVKNARSAGGGTTTVRTAMAAGGR